MWPFKKHDDGRVEIPDTHRRDFEICVAIDKAREKLYAENREFLKKNPYLVSPRWVYPTCDEDVESQPLIPLPYDDIWQYNRGEYYA